jgi:hypothetical protein
MTTTDPTTAETTDPAEHVERWTYGGVRVTRDRKRAVLWLDPDGNEMLFAAKPATRGGAVGMIYRATIIRRPTGGVSMVGRPEWTAEAHPDPELRAELAARSHAAETTLAGISMERRHADDLDAALAPLLAIARRLRGADRAALLAHVIRKIGEVW